MKNKQKTKSERGIATRAELRLAGACTECDKPMNPVEVLLGDVCLACCRKAHERVTGRGRE